jgi:hypothetical protein
MALEPVRRVSVDPPGDARHLLDALGDRLREQAIVMGDAVAKRLD